MRNRHARDIFWVALRLGLSSFGGPAAHLAYFRREYVERLHWLSEAEYAELLALCQFLPGPSSSQLGFAIGLKRGGPLGACAAWLGFTLPSLLLMYACALGWGYWSHANLSPWVLGLKAVTVGVVAHAVLALARHFCRNLKAAGIALSAAVLLYFWDAPFAQPLVLTLGALLGLWLLHAPPASQTSAGVAPTPHRRRSGLALLVLIGLLLVALTLLATHSPTLALGSSLYRTGLLVFGGGHAVLPLMHSGIVEAGWLREDAFLTGYAVAQTMPGPLFSFGAYVGTLSSVGPGGFWGALLAVVFLFLPGLLLVPALLPFWARVSGNPAFRRALAGTNAAVVGLLAAVLVGPIAHAGLATAPGVLISLGAFACLQFTRLPAWAVVFGGALAGLLPLLLI